MERLTKQEYIDKPSRIKQDNLPSYEAIYRKLAKYENTGLTPEEIANLHEELEIWKRESIEDKSKLGLLRIWLSENDLDMDDVLAKIKEKIK